MNKIGKRIRSRNQSGATVVLVAICAFFVLLPLGLFSFEIARLYLAQNQLQNAVDAAALSAITGISDNLDDAAVSDLSLNLFRRNQITSAPLKTAVLSQTVDTDNPKAFDSTYNLSIDHKKGQARATGAFGYLPAFAKGLGLGPVTIRANALAGTKPVQGDIVIAVDISDSIKGGCGINNQRSNGASSKSWIVSQHKNLKGTVPLYTYTSVTKSGGKGNPPKVVALNPVHSNSPAGLHVGGNFLHAIPDPAQIDWANNSNQVYKAFANKTLEEKVALLAESKNGNLDKLGDKKFYDPKAAKPKVPHNLDKTALAPYLPEIGDGSIPAGAPGSHVYRGAYEEVALPFVHPLADEKADAESLINQIIDNNPNANIALVGFAPRAGGHFPATSKKNPTPQLPTNNIGAFGPNYGFGESCDRKLAAKNEPFVRFTHDKDELIKTIKIATTYSGTNTTDALNVSHALLTEGQRNLKGVPQACVLLTDGIPTFGGYVKAAKKFGKDGIPIIVIGYVHIGYSAHGGPRVCKLIAKNGGPGSKYVEAPYIQAAGVPKHSFKGQYNKDNLVILKNALSGPPALVNN